jgi:hypothetical protein
VRARFVERFSMGTGGEAGNQTFKGLEDKVSWVEKFVQVGASGMEAAQEECNRCVLAPPPRITNPEKSRALFYGFQVQSNLREAGGKKSARKAAAYRMIPLNIVTVCR